MNVRSFTSAIILASTAVLLALSGCAGVNMQTMQPQKILQAVSSWSSSFMKGAAPSEEARVNAEYQKAFDTTGDNKAGNRYIIDTKSDEGPVRITLTIYPFEIIPPAAQARNFVEAATVNGKPYPPEQRRAYRNNGMKWEFGKR